MADPAERRSDPPEAAARPEEALALDSLIHERVRLGIVSALAGHERLAFTELRDALGLTDGNLSVHARKLEDAGYIASHKSFVERVPSRLPGEEAFEFAFDRGHETGHGNTPLKLRSVRGVCRPKLAIRWPVTPGL